MTITTKARGLAALLALALPLTLVAVDYAEARRGGSFGSRGTRTFSMPPPTTTAPRQVAPVERTMAPRPATNETGAIRNPGVQRPGLFGGFGRSILGGLALGGLFGLLLGHGFGGAAGMLALLVQVALIGLGVMLVMRLLRGARPATAAGPSVGPAAGPSAYARQPADMNPVRSGTGGRVPNAGSAPAGGPSDGVGLTGADFDRFEERLAEIQAAYGREDFATLRRLTTPEVMGYFAEELAEAATAGQRNEVSAVRLLQGDLAEAWREGTTDWATVAMRYESIDVMRDRATGRVVSGDADRPTETTELWTFRRDRGGDWLVSAIQDA